MHLIFDFDGTITRRDTVGELARSAIALQQSRGVGGLEAAWEEAVRAYAADHEAFRQGYRPAEAQRRSAADEARFLAGLKGVEEASLARVGRAGVFAGLGADELFRMGVEAVRAGRVVVREGFGDVVELAARRGWRVDVVSVNWSGAFIRGVVAAHRLAAVTANETDGGGRIRGPGGALGVEPMTTSPDKLRAVRHLIVEEGVAAAAAAADEEEEEEDDDDDDDGNDDRVLYFGDSTTDLECLLHRDGVVMAADGRDSALVQALERIGVDVPRVGERRARGRREGIAGWAGDFCEVLDSGVLD